MATRLGMGGVELSPPIGHTASYQARNSAEVSARMWPAGSIPAALSAS